MHITNHQTYEQQLESLWSI